MKYLSIGDVVGKQGINILKKHLPNLIKENNIDFVIVNIENIADGLGVDEDSFKEIEKISEIDCFVLGNHTWAKQEIIKYISDKRIVRPYNYGGMPGRGIRYFNKNNKDIFVIQLIGRVNIYKKSENPFKYLDKAIEEIDEYIIKNNKYKDESNEEYIKKEEIIILLDFHVDATSEAIFMGYYADGKISSILCSHTHVQTADERILPKGSAYITDLGMTGSYESVLGMNIDIAYKRFVEEKKSKYEISENETSILCAAIVDIDDNTKKAKEIIKVRIID